MNFKEAKARFVHRYTMEHVPAWAKKSLPNGKYPAPQYKTDAEWFEKTEFFDPSKPVEEQTATRNSCYSQSPSWPLGMSLEYPFEG